MLEYSLLNDAYPNFKKKIINTKNITTNTNSNISSNTNCEPLQQPTYTIPISNETKNKYNEVYEISLMNNNNNDSNYKFYDETTSKNNNVKPFFDDEIYSSINEIKNTSNDIIKDDNLNYDNLLFILNNIKNNYFTIHDKELKKFYDILINLSFFIFIGLIIILLCDQITKLSNVIYIKELYNSINNI